MRRQKISLLQNSALTSILLSIGIAHAAPFPTPEEVLKESRKGIRFSNACAKGRKITIAAVGDILLHDGPQIQAVHDPERYISLWGGVRDLLARTDLTYANLEGPVAWGIDRNKREVPDPGFVFDDIVYSGLPRLNYHHFLLDDMVASGIDIVSTANNHAMDRGPLGLERTIDALRAAGLPFAGTRKSNERDQKWFTITEANGIKIGWISCTRRINPDKPYPKDMVLNCHNDTNEIEKLIRRIVRKKEADAVIVVPHWGAQFTHIPKEKQIEIARRFVEAGALAVIGSHPHAIQPWERIITRDGRETFVFYSLGNFVSGHRQLQRRVTLILQLGLTRTTNGKVVVNGVNYIPVLMTRDNGFLTAQALDRHPQRETTQDVQEARNLLKGILGTSNVAPTHAPVVTNPECME
ncbi:MAG: hypothetical protein A2X94_06480 [Bdellovibrionales bacterium GWB1_55_8]|nr:MAG: hypothetical protein A2X94_06480 [Bdellovibrionales bacterium GWB1_55_8]